jgi:dihydrofolate reductase
MGRHVFSDIGGKPLPGRINIVVSSTLTQSDTQTEVYASLDAAIESGKQHAKAASTDLFLIGGRRIYEEGLKIADRLYVTEVNQEYAGDITFPEYRNEIGSTWMSTSVTPGEEVTFKVYDRNSSI